MKKFIVLTFLLLTALTACGGESIEESRELTVSVFDSIITKPFVEEAAALFMYMHPDVTITVESFSSMPEVRTVEMDDGTTMMVSHMEDSAQERRDYINQINTELMSGRGADILGFDVLPFHRYAQQGQLADLRRFMDNDPNFNIYDYRANILDMLTTDAGLFKFPISYSFDYLTFDSTLFAQAQREFLETNDVFTLESLFAIGYPALESAWATESQYQMMPTTASTLFRTMFDLYHSHFIDIENRTANFTDGLFVDMLNQLQYFEDTGLLRESAPEMNMDTISTIGIASSATDRYAFKIKTLFTLFFEFARDDPNTPSLDFGIGITDDDMIAGLLSNSLGQVPFSFGQIGTGTAFGINANSQNQDLAWEFIKFLSSDAIIEILQNPGGIPLHIGAFEESARRSASNFFFRHHFNPDMAGEAIELTPAEQARFDAYTATVAHFTSLLNTFHTTDSIMTDMVIEAVAEFFEGNISAEDLAQNLQSRVSLMLNE
ncbi:MAG: ABC transporter substrate-binding protein [Defluviitaleaceae bacterium]|nr:ABC transporter substrate-binding protein [Defluviitaleaceae bacterium]